MRLETVRPSHGLQEARMSSRHLRIGLKEQQDQAPQKDVNSTTDREMEPKERGEKEHLTFLRGSVTTATKWVIFLDSVQKSRLERGEGPCTETEVAMEQPEVMIKGRGAVTSPHFKEAGMEEQSKARVPVIHAANLATLLGNAMHQKMSRGGTTLEGLIDIKTGMALKIHKTLD